MSTDRTPPYMHYRGPELLATERLFRTIQAPKKFEDAYLKKIRDDLATLKEQERAVAAPEQKAAPVTPVGRNRAERRRIAHGKKRR